MGHEVDTRKPAVLLKCKANDADGCLGLGRFVQAGRSRLHRAHADGMFARALEIAGQSCQTGSPTACLTVADVLRETGRSSDADKLNLDVSTRLEVQCTGGDFTACLALADLYEDGHGVKVSAAKAQALRARACKIGASAMCD